ncbi:MAG: tetratricopeptide repeat protein [Geitlerinemataceae cyanobacterium]
MTNQTGEIFLARTQEQAEFRRILQELVGSRLARSLPTFHKLAKRLTPDAEPASTQPQICLFYGEGGMGKSTLSRRLEKIAKQAPFKCQVATVRLDWEDAKRDRTELQVEHDCIEPETVLALLHSKLEKETDKKCLDEFVKTRKALRDAEQKIDAALKKPEVNAAFNKKVIDGGSRAIAAILQKRAGIDVNTTQPYLVTGLEVTMELVDQAKAFVGKSLKKPEQIELFEQPSQKLAQVLGAGIAKVAARKPLVVFLDTYEIVDRPECDAIVRAVMREAGARVVWVVTGRANLAESGKRGGVYVRGYSSEFSEDRLYAKSLSGFGRETILEFFRQAVPGRSLTEGQAEQVDRFSLGIPFVVNEVEAMWRKEVEFEAIVAPVEKAIGENAHLRVIEKASERFLVHCLTEPEDLAAVYALAMMRRPSSELFAAMVDSADVVARVQSLRSRYSFVLESGGLRLSEKLAGFVREYLRSSEMRRAQYRQLNENAMAWLEMRLEQKSVGITDTAELFEEEEIAQLRADWIHHQFWIGEDEGWRTGLTWFVLGWEYAQNWLAAEFAELKEFVGSWSRDGQKRLEVFEKGYQRFIAESNAVEKLIEMLEKHVERKHFSPEFEDECGTIVRLVKGRCLEQQEKYLEALPILFEVDKTIQDKSRQLCKNLASSLAYAGQRLSLVKGRVVPSVEAERVLLRAIELQSGQSEYWRCLGIVQYGLGQHREAHDSFNKALYFNPENAEAYGNLGWISLKRNQISVAKEQCKKALEIDPNLGSAVINYGLILALQSDTESARYYWKRSIDIHCKTGEKNYSAPSTQLSAKNQDMDLLTLKEFLKRVVPL